MIKIYTKKGDCGVTATMRGKMGKGEQLAETLGAIDELNSWLGLISPSLIPPLKLRGGDGGDTIKSIQKNLMLINSILAGADKKFNDGETLKLEKLIDKLQTELPELKNFIYPVGKLQVVRAVARRCEREVVKYFEISSSGPPLCQRGGKGRFIIKYLNRLSDALFVMARWVNMKDGVEEEAWTV